MSIYSPVQNGVDEERHLASWTAQPDPRRQLADADPEIYDVIEQERRRQYDGIELIASENYVSSAVLAAMGSVLTNKYAEGYPGKRYYGGCEIVDIAERIAIERAKQVFGAEHANVQPHAGAQANESAYLAFLKPGDTVLAMKLDQGGHLTHGSPMNFSGRLYNFVHYGVDRETERVDYGDVQQRAEEHRPKLIVAGASSYPRHFDFARLREIADSVGALLMMDMAHVAGLVAAGVHPDPVPYCDVVTSTTHKTLRGPRGGMILCREEHARAIDRAVFPGAQGGPLMHVIAAKAVGFGEALKPDFRSYQQQILDNAQALARSLEDEGLRLVSGGTDNHLVLVDLDALGNDDITGIVVQEALGEAALHTNRNVIPFDPRSPQVTSGLRVGTPAATTRGLGTEEFAQVGRWIAAVAKNPFDAKLIARTRAEVLDMVRQFPVPA